MPKKPHVTWDFLRHNVKDQRRRRRPSESSCWLAFSWLKDSSQFIIDQIHSCIIKLSHLLGQRDHSLLRKPPNPHRYHLNDNGRKITTALFTVLQADIAELTKAAA